MSGLFGGGGGGGSRPAVNYQPAPIQISVPTIQSKEVEKAGAKARKAALAAKGRGATIATGAAGLEEEAPVKKTTLLGGGMAG